MKTRLSLAAWACTSLGVAAAVALAVHAQTPAPQAAAPLAGLGKPIEVDVNQGAVQPLPIAIPSFSGAEGAEIAKVVSDDLQSSGLFAPVAQADTVQSDLNTDVVPAFANWKTAGAQALVVGRTAQSGNQISVSYRLWDVSIGAQAIAANPNAGSPGQMLATTYNSATDNLRTIGHKIADDIYQKLTGEGGYFNSRIVFVAESGPRNKRVKRLALMDQDSFNPRFLTQGGDDLILTPRFSSNSQEITYMKLSATGSAIYLFDLDSGRQEKIGDFPGLVFAPRFSPDGGSVAFSVERAGNSDIYVMNLRSRQSTRLTTDPAIDTSPSYSPDGSQIVFTSDRAGSAQLYVMAANGSGAHRISSGSGLYTTPVWSPKGDFIAFTKQTGQTFHIGVMRPDGSDERLLTTSYLDEGPTWAPNGRVLMFDREPSGADPKLWTVDITGRILRPSPHDGAASDPAWSPLLN